MVLPRRSGFAHASIGCTDGCRSSRIKSYWIHRCGCSRLKPARAGEKTEGTELKLGSSHATSYRYRSNYPAAAVSRCASTRSVWAAADRYAPPSSSMPLQIDQKISATETANDPYTSGKFSQGSRKM